MSEEQVHRVGRFTVRVAPPDSLLYNGPEGACTREPDDRERGHVILEIYDPRHPGSPLGQIVTAYLLESVLDITPRTRLVLQPGVAAWTMTKAETTALVALAHASAPTATHRTKATREQRLEAGITELEAELANATHSLGHAVQALGGELRFPHQDPSVHPTSGIETTTDGRLDGTRSDPAGSRPMGHTRPQPALRGDE